jgi:serine/threonine-protein kinase mTOR
MIAATLGPAMTRLLHDVVDLMMQWGLSAPLVQSLHIIAKHIPPLLKPIQGQSFEFIASL